MTKRKVHKPEIETRNSKVLKDFVKYCLAHPHERFWQALLNWTRAPYICMTSRPPFKDLVVGKDIQVVDTYYFEGKSD